MLKHSNITIYYYFLAEAMIAFIVLLPITFEYYEPIHYWCFLFNIFIIGFCYYILEMLRKSISYFLIVIPIGLLLFYLWQFPIGLVIIFPLIFTWRYARIRTYRGGDQDYLHLHAVYNKYEKQREKAYLHIALLSSVFVAFYTKELYAVVYSLFLLFILLAGNLISRIAVIEKQDRENVSLKVLLPVPIIVIIGSVLVFYLFNPFRELVYYVWTAITSLFTFLISGLAFILNLIIPEAKVGEEDNFNNNEPLGDFEDPYSQLFPDGPSEGIDPNILVFGTIVVIIAVIIYFMLKAFRQEREDDQINVDQTVTHDSLDDPRRNQFGFFDRILQRFASKPTDPVRNLVYEFERKANRRGYGRFPHESIEEWFKRLDIHIHTVTYQKVRYGHLDVTEEEVAELKQQLLNVEKDLNA